MERLGANISYIFLEHGTDILQAMLVTGKLVVHLGIVYRFVVYFILSFTAQLFAYLT
jgi:hypothetical protein